MEREREKYKRNRKKERKKEKKKKRKKERRKVTKNGRKKRGKTKEGRSKEKRTIKKRETQKEKSTFPPLTSKRICPPPFWERARRRLIRPIPLANERAVNRPKRFAATPASASRTPSLSLWLQRRRRGGDGENRGIELEKVNGKRVQRKCERCCLFVC